MGAAMVDGAPRRDYTGSVHRVISGMWTSKEDEMVKQLAAIAILVSVVSLAAAACGGGDDEAAAPPPPAAAAAPGATAAPAADAQETVPVRSGVTGIDENGVIQYSIYVVGGGGSGGEKSTIFGAAAFGYDVEEITFNVGDTVHFTAIPTEDVKQSHTFSIPEFNALASLRFGNTGETTVTFDKPGRFIYRCNTHAGEGETGFIIVQ